MAPIIIIGIIVLYVLSSNKVLREYEIRVIFRLSRLLPEAKGPGLILVFSPVDLSPSPVGSRGLVDCDASG